MYYPNQVAFIPSQFELVGRAFSRLKGSWEKIFNGDITQIKKLKTIVKAAVESGYISKTSNEGPKKAPPKVKSDGKTETVGKQFSKNKNSN